MNILHLSLERTALPDLLIIRMEVKIALRRKLQNIIKDNSLYEIYTNAVNACKGLEMIECIDDNASL